MNSINNIILPETVLRDTFKVFRDYGNHFLEACALWVGVDSKDIFYIKEVWFPPQENSMIDYYVSDIDVHMINVKLNKKNYSAIAQLHTHPNGAFHSCIDDEFPILTLPGSLSIVIPDFANLPIKSSLNEMVVYRLIFNEWKLQSKKEVKILFKIVE
ncbi:hypothetical protein ES708_15690 [subsurface metagenome]